MTTLKEKTEKNPDDITDKNKKWIKKLIKANKKFKEFEEFLLNKYKLSFKNKNMRNLLRHLINERKEKKYQKSLKKFKEKI